MQNLLPAAGSISLEGEAGTIEGYLEYAGDTPRFSGLVCHPNPLQGGTFNNKVVTTLTRTCRRLGGAALRFNFRGVGASDGAHADGLGEVEDTVRLAAWLRQRVAGPFWLAGFSFGSMVATRAAARLAAEGKKVDDLLLVAPPVQLYDWPLLADCDCPVTVIQGEADEVVSVEDVSAWVASQGTEAAIIRLPDCSHFFHGRLRELAQAAETTLP